jgi:ParB-like chromosome segregation protein Spo0J
VKRAAGMRAVAELRPHPWRTLAPGMTAAEQARLQASIETYGLQEPLAITASGIVLDGCERLNVARQLGLEAVPVRIVAPASEPRYVAESLLQRKHLSAGQKAAVAIELAAIEHALHEGKARKLQNLRRGHSSEEAVSATSRNTHQGDRGGDRPRLRTNRPTRPDRAHP